LPVGTKGIDAVYSWAICGGNGKGSTIYDIEIYWSVNREDLVDASVWLNIDPGDEGCNPSNGPHHGTAVLGEMVDINNGFGVKGISLGVQAKVVPEVTIRNGIIVPMH
jgi:hypothetical protein